MKTQIIKFLEHATVVLFLIIKRLILGSPVIIALILLQPKEPDKSLDGELLFKTLEPDNASNQQKLAVLKLMHSQAIAQSQDSSPSVDLPFLPNRSLTPGAIFKEATLVTICIPGYSFGINYIPPNIKSKVYQSYGIKNFDQYHIDHFIALELGGSNDITNLWAQPYRGQWNAHDKRKLALNLHHRVCAGTLPLSQAQKEIAFDWVAAYKNYVGEK